MIPYDFDYYRPSEPEEAVQLFHQLDQQGKQPMYFNGGTEIITLGRMNQLVTGAVIDVKSIAACQAWEEQPQKDWRIGSAVTLSHLQDSKRFPLLSEVAGNIADRTSRNKITLGGNLCSWLIYREAVLPLLLTECRLQIAGRQGIRSVSIQDVFDRRLHLQPGELLVDAVIDMVYFSLPYKAVKMRKQATIDYPLVSVAAIQTDHGIRAAFSGLCAFPFRSKVMEEQLNRSDLSIESRAERALDNVPSPVLNDIKGSAEYRSWVTRTVLMEILAEWEGEANGNTPEQ